MIYDGHRGDFIKKISLLTKIILWNSFTIPMPTHSSEFENFFPLDDKRNYQRYGEKKKGKLNNNELSYKRYIKLYQMLYKYGNFNFRERKCK